MVDLVFDSYALLEWLLGQPKAAVVRRYLDEAAADRSNLAMSWINVGEVFYMLWRKKGAERAEEFLRRLPSLPIRLVIPGIESVLGAARLKAKLKVSYADAFALELAIGLSGRIVTGDPEIEAAQAVPVCWVGPEEPRGKRHRPRRS